MAWEDYWNPNVPGEVDGLQFSDKQITLNADVHIQDRIPITIAPNTGDLDKGTILGVQTTDGLFHPVRRYALSTAAASGATSVTVTGATLFQVGDTVSVMQAAGTGVEPAGTVSSTVYNSGANTTTVTFSTATAEALVVGDFIYASDGSQKALVILADVVLDATSNKVSNAYVAGKFVKSQLVGVDSIALTDLSARSIPYTINSVADNILVV
jgi:hypothetical protein